MGTLFSVVHPGRGGHERIHDYIIFVNVIVNWGRYTTFDEINTGNVGSPTE